MWIVVYSSLADYDPCDPGEDQQGPNCTNPDVDPTPQSGSYCAVVVLGESCIDDIGIFRASDLRL